MDLFNRKTIDYSADPRKTSSLVKQAFMTVGGSLENINIFQTGRGNEFNSQLIEETLEAFDITRSLSHKGCPYDNTVAEATFKIIKTEFVKNQIFMNMDTLKLQLSDYVNWFNNNRIHSSLGYLTPVEYRMNNLKKLFSLLLTIHIWIRLFRPQFTYQTVSCYKLLTALAKKR